MIVLPAVAGLGLALVLALLSIQNMSREVTNLRHVAENDYERQPQNPWVLLFALIGALVLLGAVGAGPCAGLVMVETLR